MRRHCDPRLRLWLHHNKNTSTLSSFNRIAYRKALRAAATAVSTSDALAACICAVTCPLAGLMVSIRLPDSLRRHSLSTNSCVNEMMNGKYNVT